MEFFGAIAGLVEVAVIVAAGLVYFRARGYRVSESILISLTLAMLGLSLVFQVAFLVQRPALAYPLEALLVGACAWLVACNRRELCHCAGVLWRFATDRPALASVVGAAWMYLAGLALLLPPSNPDSLRYHLTRVLLFQQEGSFFLNVPANNQAPLAVFPVGSDILSHLFLRFGTDYGLGIFVLMSYVAIVFGAYALACRHASRRVAVMSALVIAGLPELVYMATAAGKNDIVMAAAALLCLHLGDRLCQRLDPLDLALLALALAFGVSTKTLFLGFALPYVLLLGGFLVARHGTAGLKRAVWHPRQLLAILVPLAILSQSWLFLHNVRVHDHWSGPPTVTDHIRNQDGLAGAIANVTRYALLSVDVLKVGDLAARNLTGTSAAHWLEGVYDRVFFPLWGQAGSDSPFRIQMSIDESKAWFGPLGFLLLLPALAFGLWRGTWRLRITVLALSSYFLIVSWQVAWTMWHGRYFAPVFVGAAPCLARWLADWRRLPRGLQMIEVTAVLLLVYSCLFNQLKPLVPLTLDPAKFVDQLVRKNIWASTDWGTHRQFFYGNSSALEDFAHRIESGDRVGLLPADPASLYFYPRRRPDARFQVLAAESVQSGAVPASESAGLQWLLCVGLESCSTLEIEGGGSPVTCHEVDGRFDDYCLYRVTPP